MADYCQLVFLILISLATFFWFPESIELLAWFISKKKKNCLSPAVSNFPLQSSLYKQINKKHWSKGRLFTWRRRLFNCSDEIILLSIINIFSRPRCLLLFHIFSFAIPFPDLFIKLKKISLDSGNFVLRKCSTNEIVFIITFD